MSEKHPFVAAQERIAAFLTTPPDPHTLSEEAKTRDELAFLEAAKTLGYKVPSKDDSTSAAVPSKDDATANTQEKK
jgi:hypothetical protein